jgi:hypothetical protein
MADRERSSSPSFAGQRTTAGGLGVPPAQQVRPRACGVMPTLFVILTLNWTWREEAQCTLVFTALIFYMLSCPEVSFSSQVIGSELPPAATV